MTPNRKNDDAMIRRAFALAKNGVCTSMPNPRVGCVIARDGKIIAEGWHRRPGEAHAEIVALNQIKGRADNADIFVTLAPCTTHGKTPPCALAIIAANPRRVAVAMADPNPREKNGVAALRQAGIFAEFLEFARAEAAALNRGFISRMIRNRPWIRLKIAATLDGKTALDSGLSQWITGAESRRDAHFLRAQSCAILTGIGTAFADNPQFTVRESPSPNPPMKVLVDGKLKANPELKIFAEGRVLLATAAANSQKKFPPNVAVEKMPAVENGKVDLAHLANRLGELECNEVTVEAGARLNGALLSAGLADEIVVYVAGKIFGSGRQMFDLTPKFTPAIPADAPQFHLAETEILGGDVKLIFLSDSADELESHCRKLENAPDNR